MVSVIVNSLLISALPLPKSRHRRQDGIVPGYHFGMSLVSPYTVIPLTVVPVLFGPVYRNALICGCRGGRLPMPLMNVLDSGLAPSWKSAFKLAASRYLASRVRKYAR